MFGEGRSEFRIGLKAGRRPCGCRSLSKSCMGAVSRGEVELTAGSRSKVMGRAP